MTHTAFHAHLATIREEGTVTVPVWQMKGRRLREEEGAKEAIPDPTGAWCGSGLKKAASFVKM